MRLFNKALDYLVDKISDRLCDTHVMDIQIVAKYIETLDLGLLAAQHISIDKLAEAISCNPSFENRVADQLTSRESKLTKKVGDYIEENLSSSADFINAVAREIDVDDVAGIVREYIDNDEIAERIQESISEAFVRHLKRFSV